MDAIENIKKYMKERGLTQKELATKSGLRAETINRILNSKKPLALNTLSKIADGLQVSISDLNEEKKRKPNKTTNNEVKGYLQIGEKITQITSFTTLKKCVEEYQEITDLGKQVEAIKKEEAQNANKVNKKNIAIRKEDIDFYRKEEIDASKVEIYSFQSKGDKRDGIVLNLGNMISPFSITINCRVFRNSEALYICGLFSENTQEHQNIQKELIRERNGLNTKKVIRARSEEKYGRKDWNDFNVEWMKWCVWQKIKENEDFRRLLLSLPSHALIVENSISQESETSTFWGAKNQELEDKRNLVVDYIKRTSSKFNEKTSKKKVKGEINHIGTWYGTNAMGKILKYMQLCLIDNEEPKIDYELLRSKNIYLFGELLRFEDEIALTESKRNKTLIFDFDGTLLDTEPLKKYEYLFTEPKQGSKEWKQGRKEYLSHIKDCKMWNGMDEVIHFIRRNQIPTCIVTANTKDRVVEAIKAFGWKDVFDKDRIIGCYAKGRTRVSKDNGNSTLFMEALKVLNVEATDCVAFGNEISDTLAAQNAGIKAYNCLWGAAKEEQDIMKREMADNTISTPQHIIEVLKHF